MKFNYENLDVTKLARSVIKDIYIISKKYPSSEIYGLTSQTRRAAVSVLLNIAEGNSRNSRKDFGHFVLISIGSLVETDCALKIAIDLQYLNQNDYDFLEPRIKELYFKLIGLSKYLKQQ
jgi:four helix bundle protein